MHLEDSPRGGRPGEVACRSPDAAAAAAAAAAADPRDMIAAMEKSVARGLHPDMASSSPPASIPETVARPYTPTRSSVAAHTLRRECRWPVVTPR